MMSNKAWIMLMVAILAAMVMGLLSRGTSWPFFASVLAWGYAQYLLGLFVGRGR